MALSPGLKQRRDPMLGGGPMQLGAPSPTVQPQKPSFFAEGGTGRAIAGNLGDTLLQLANMAPVYGPAVQQQRQMDYDRQRRQIERAEGLEDWVAKQEYERANPKPVNNDTVADYDFYKRTLTPEQFNTWLQNKVDPPQYRQGADGQFYRINVAPPPAITEDEWSKGTPVGGGQSASPTGNFPR